MFSLVSLAHCHEKKHEKAQSLSHKDSKICKVFGVLHIFDSHFPLVKSSILRDSCKRPSVSTISKLLSARTIFPDCKSSNISVNNHPSTCFSYGRNNSTRSLPDQVNSVVALVIPPGHSLCKQTTLSVDKYFNSHFKFIVCPQAHGHCLS